MLRLKICIIPSIILAMFLTACGDKKDDHPIGRSFNSATEKAFHQAAEKYKVPMRLMMAVAYMESGINPKRSFTSLFNRVAGPELGETAFGLSRSLLELSPNLEGDKIEAQVDAYAKWLSVKLVDSGLVEDPKEPAEIFAWVWQLALLHRQESIEKRNLRSIFARELIDVLNRGFYWIDPDSKQLIEFAPEEEALVASRFAPESQALLQLSNTRAGDVQDIDFFNLLPTDADAPTWVPQGIEITHCPFSLSSCLALQTQSSPTNGVFEAHYLIPPSKEASGNILQVARHRKQLRRLDQAGIIGASNRIIVMLVGASGRIVDGERTIVNPEWLSKWQMQNAGKLIAGISGVCDALMRDHGENFPWNREECTMLGKGVTVRNYPQNNPVIWGEVPDLDEKVLNAYLKNPGGLSGTTHLNFESSDKVYSAGKVRFQAAFQVNARALDVEKLIRCENGDLIWAAVATGKELRSRTRVDFEEEYYTAGPNNNGDHFLRARVYDRNGQLIGWDVQRFILRNYDAKSAVFHRDCQGS